MIVYLQMKQIQGFTSADVPPNIAKNMVNLEAKISQTIMPVKSRLFKILDESRPMNAASMKRDELSVSVQNSSVRLI